MRSTVVLVAGVALVAAACSGSAAGTATSSPPSPTVTTLSASPTSTAGSAGRGEQGLASTFFESAEYPDEVVSRDEFLARFPGGRYTLTGTSRDGVPLALTATLADLIPEPAVILAPEEGAVVPAGDVTIAWEPVEEPAGVEPEVYTVQLFPVDPPEGADPIALDVDLTFEVPADVTEVRIPGELLAPGEVYQYELMVVDAGGNQTFTVGSFTTTE